MRFFVNYRVPSLMGKNIRRFIKRQWKTNHPSWKRQTMSANVVVFPVSRSLKGSILELFCYQGYVQNNKPMSYIF